MLTSEVCINQFINEYKFRIERNTLVCYLASIRQLLSFCEKPFNNVTTRDIRSWFIHLEEDGYKQSTIKHKLIGLRLFYRYCLEEEIMTHNPAEKVPLPKDEDKLPYYLTNEQLMKLRLFCEDNLQQRAVIEVFYATGVRLRELTNMKLENIQWSERMIRIPEGKGKKERIVLFTNECSEHLKVYLQSRCDELPFVFVNRDGTASIYPRVIQNWFENYRKKLGFYLTPHTLRHTFAAHLTMKGMKMAYIQTLLGHENPRHTHFYSRLHCYAQKQMYDEWM